MNSSLKPKVSKEIQCQLRRAEELPRAAEPNEENQPERVRKKSPIARVRAEERKARCTTSIQVSAARRLSETKRRTGSMKQRYEE